jgi:beta-lactam-binding protein with PASTA domain
MKQLAIKNVHMPALSSTMKEGKVIAWSKKIGEAITVGDVLLVVESDKVNYFFYIYFYIDIIVLTFIRLIWR